MEYYDNKKTISYNYFIILQSIAIVQLSSFFVSEMLHNKVNGDIVHT